VVDLFKLGFLFYHGFLEMLWVSLTRRKNSVMLLLFLQLRCQLVVYEDEETSPNHLGRLVSGYHYPQNIFQ
jgi:hypothetical protein